MRVFEIFREICAIPHGSGNEHQISDYLMAFAKKLGLEVSRDEYLNVLIKKPGNTGTPAVVMQAHMDMVNEKNVNTEHDFLTEGIRVIEDGEWLKADGTTLGADNGIGIALMLAVLESKDISHPDIEALFTTEEETRMWGAQGFDANLLKGRVLLNLDSEEEGVLTSSSAGGCKTGLIFDTEFEELPEGMNAYSVKVKGLSGGHSGLEINKQKGNAIKLTGRILNAINEKFDFNIIRINGGLKDNAIPRECEAVIAVKEENAHDIADIVGEFDRIFKQEYRVSDGTVYAVFETAEKTRMMSKGLSKRIITAITLCPVGVHAMSLDIAGLVETSSNLGTVETHPDKVSLGVSVRSSVESRLEMVTSQITALGNILGAETEIRGHYPPWEYRQQSELRRIIANEYSRLFGGEILVTACHAGLECGWFARKVPGMDIVSMGPDIRGAHTPDERVNVPSVERTFELLKNVLGSL